MLEHITQTPNQKGKKVQKGNKAGYIQFLERLYQFKESNKPLTSKEIYKHRSHDLQKTKLSQQIQFTE